MRGRNMVRRLLIATCLLAVLGTASAQKRKTRDEQVRDDRKNLENKEGWVYNDLEKATRLAKSTNKPMLLVFR